MDSNQASGAPKNQSPPFDELSLATAPNLLTLSRIIFVPIVVTCLFVSLNASRLGAISRAYAFEVAAALLFGVAAITDYFDGYLARRQNQVSVVGKLMDPLADKFIVVCSLVMLQHMERVHPAVVMLLICREMAITGLRALASAEGVIIAASDSGKWKTTLQMIAIPFMMVKEGVFGIPLFEIGEVLLYGSVGISLWSAKDYAVEFFKSFREGRKIRAQAKKAAREARIAKRDARLAAKAKT